MAADHDLVDRGAAELAAEIRAGRVSSRECLDAFTARVEALDGPLNLVVTRDFDNARETAAQRDAERARGECRGPLHGVPMTIKDSFQTRGLRTTSGAPELSAFVPAVDADPVARLRAAGAVIFGKTNLPIYAGDVQSYNEVFGQSNNPWSTDHSVGGSSGGSAGALAAGFTPLELGSDIGGSIRNPAHCCGICGHKPSYGIVSARGQIPGPPGTLTQADLAVAGPMARSVEDLRLALDVLAGPDSWHESAWRLDLPPARHDAIDDFRIAVWIDDPFCPLSEPVRGLLEAAARELQREGATVDFGARPEFEAAYADGVFQQLLGAALSPQYRLEEIELWAADGADGGDLGWQNATLRHRAWLSANERRLQMRRKWRRFFRDWDVALLPVSPLPAIPHDHSQPMSARTIVVDGEERPYLDQIKWMGLTGVAYLPATVVPVGTTPEGLPVGLQIAGPFLEDKTPLRVAEILLDILGGCPRPPGF